MTLIIFILALCVLIVVHEWGHFIAAKLFGIRVEEFAIGFPPRLGAVRHRDTEYSVNLLLFGGFVRIFGEHVDEHANLAYDRKNFSHRSRFIQAAVIVAGIVMNIVFAWVLFSGIYMAGMPTEVDATNQGQVQNVQLMIIAVFPNSPAEKAGIEGGDIITTLQTATATLTFPASSDQAQQFITSHISQSFVLTAMRNGVQKYFVLTAAAGAIPNDPTRKAVGVEFADIGTLHLAPLPAVLSGAGLVYQETVLTAEGLTTFFGNLLIGRANFSEVAGPVGIAQAGAAAAAAGWVQLLFFAAIISINLALINILPIPGLDGGRLLFIVIEGIRKKAIPERTAARLTVAGFGLLILLMVIITYHDIVRIW